MVNQDDCFKRLEQLVLEENKQVTYKVLSREMKIHVNEAKRYLNEFFIVTGEKTTLYSSYFLAGTVKDNGVETIKIVIATQDNLEKEKKKLAEVTSCHIYSVSKTTPDKSALFKTDQYYSKNLEDQKKYSAIRHSNIEIQPPVLNTVNTSKNDSKSTVVKNEPPKSVKNTPTPAQVVKEKDQKQLSTSDTIKQEKKEGQERNGQVKKSNAESKSQKSNPLASLWQKNEEKSNSKSETNKVEVKGKGKSPQETKKVQKNNIFSMFSKQAEKNAANPPKKTSPAIDPVAKKTSESVSPKKELSSPQLEKVQENIKTTKAATKKRKASQKETKTSKQKNDSGSDEDFQTKKKHRRIRAFQESDSESECEEEMDKAQRSLWLSEDPLEGNVPTKAAIPSSDEEPIPPTPPVVSHNKGKKKLWKTVQKNYQDEDGFFVTKQEKVLMTESESDEDPIPKKVSPKKEVKVNAFSCRKQASLTSFFKQK